MGGSFVSSMALMLIPGSSISKIDLSTASTRIGIQLNGSTNLSANCLSTVYTFDIIGPQYVSGEMILVVLSIGILPFSIMINSISKFNYLADSRKLILIGSSQIVTFLIAFFFLIPKYGTLGAAYSTFIAFLVSSYRRWFGQIGSC